MNIQNTEEITVNTQENTAIYTVTDSLITDFDTVSLYPTVSALRKLEKKELNLAYGKSLCPTALYLKEIIYTDTESSITRNEVFCECGWSAEQELSHLQFCNGECDKLEYPIICPTAGDCLLIRCKEDIYTDEDGGSCCIKCRSER